MNVNFNIINILLLIKKKYFTINKIANIINNKCADCQLSFVSINLYFRLNNV